MIIDEINQCQVVLTVESSKFVLNSSDPTKNRIPASAEHQNTKFNNINNLSSMLKKKTSKKKGVFSIQMTNNV
jgi:hypothetical protein